MKAGGLFQEESLHSLGCTPSSGRVRVAGRGRARQADPSASRTSNKATQTRCVVCILNILNHHSCVLSFTTSPPRPPQHLTPNFSSSDSQPPSCALLQSGAFDGEEREKPRVLKPLGKPCFLTTAEDLVSRQRHDLFLSVPGSPLNQAGRSLLLLSFFSPLFSDLSS